MRVKAMDFNRVGASDRLPPHADRGMFRLDPRGPVPGFPSDLPPPAADIAVAMRPSDVNVFPSQGRIHVTYEITNDKVPDRPGIAPDLTVEIRVNGETVHVDQVPAPQPGHWVNERVVLTGLNIGGDVNVDGPGGEVDVGGNGGDVAVGGNGGGFPVLDDIPGLSPITAGQTSDDTQVEAVVTEVSSDGETLASGELATSNPGGDKAPPLLPENIPPEAAAAGGGLGLLWILGVL